MAFLAVLRHFLFLMIIYITFILKALYAPQNRFIRGVRGIFIKNIFKNKKDAYSASSSGSSSSNDGVEALTAYLVSIFSSL